MIPLHSNHPQPTRVCFREVNFSLSPSMPINNLPIEGNEHTAHARYANHYRSCIWVYLGVSSWVSRGTDYARVGSREGAYTFQLVFVYTTAPLASFTSARLSLNSMEIKACPIDFVTRLKMPNTHLCFLFLHFETFIDL